SDSSVAMWTGIALTLTPLIQGAFAHTQAALLAKASAIPGIEKIKTLPDAPSAITAVANDPNVPNVVPAVTLPNPYAIARGKS
ncbi:MAG TPA: hypothetical protein VGZ92_12215, partial [Bradyrhizobium sp.]|nr:hypothetical protein [Bradyrhizobium sp.]